MPTSLSVGIISASLCVLEVGLALCLRGVRAFAHNCIAGLVFVTLVNDYFTICGGNYFQYFCLLRHLALYETVAAFVLYSHRFILCVWPLCAADVVILTQINITSTHLINYFQLFLYSRLLLGWL